MVQDWEPGEGKPKPSICENVIKTSKTNKAVTSTELRETSTHELLKSIT